jgi:hypothetical protein
MSKAPIPAWISAFITHCYPLLGLEGWEITTRLADHVDCQDRGVDGEANVNFRYLCATITLQRDIAPDEDGYTRLVHELLHVACGRQSQGVVRLVDDLPRRQRKRAMNRWDDSNEQTVTILARALTPLLRAGFTSPPDKESK